MSDDLVKRLRGPIAEAAQAYTDDWFNNPDTQRPVHSIPAKESDTDLTLAMGIKEAADRIEELEAEAKRLETESNLQAKEIDKTRQRSDKWQSMILDCEQYLKPNETPAERIQREIDDCLGMMKLLEKKQTRIAELEAKLEKAVGALDEAVYLLAPTEDDMEKRAGVYRVVTTLAELKGDTDE